MLPKDVPVIVVGGIKPDTMAPWLDAGADGFGLGSGLYRPGQSRRGNRRQRPRLCRRRSAADEPLSIAIIGFGKIAADQHVPVDRRQSALRAGRDVEPLRAPGREPSFTDWRELLARSTGLEAVAITTPPSAALRDRARLHRARACTCLLEKPPTATLERSRGARLPRRRPAR